MFLGFLFSAGFDRVHVRTTSLVAVCIRVITVICRIKMIRRKRVWRRNQGQILINYQIVNIKYFAYICFAKSVLSCVRSVYALEKPGQIGISKMFWGCRNSLLSGNWTANWFLKVQLDPPLSNTHWSIDVCIRVLYSILLLYVNNNYLICVFSFF